MVNINQKIVFTAWMGPGELTDNRKNALISMQNHIGCPLVLITKVNLKQWVKPEFPLHPLFDLLSAVHQCDYLRCYLLHVYGGGYTDIKSTNKSWIDAFDQVFSSDSYGLGYTEVGPQGVARVGGELEQEMKQNYQKLIGVCSLIFKPGSVFTANWFEIVNQTISAKADALIKNPAKHPQDHFNVQFADGSKSRYPFEWTEVGGNIIHPLAYQYRDNILHGDISPSFSNYR